MKNAYKMINAMAVISDDKFVHEQFRPVVSTVLHIHINLNDGVERETFIIEFNDRSVAVFLEGLESRVFDLEDIEDVVSLASLMCCQADLSPIEKENRIADVKKACIEHGVPFFEHRVQNSSAGEP